MIARCLSVVVLLLCCVWMVSSAPSAQAATQVVQANAGTIQWPSANPSTPPANGTLIQTGANLQLPLFDPSLGFLTQVDLVFNFSTLYGGTIRNFSGSSYSGSIVSGNGTNVIYAMAPFGQLWNFNAPAEGATTATALGNFQQSFMLSSPTRGHGSPATTFTNPAHLAEFIGIGNTSNLNATQRYTVSLATSPVVSGVTIPTFQRAFNPRATATYTYNPFATPTDGGGGLSFEIAEGPQSGQGQVQPTPLGASHRHEVSAAAPGSAVTESTTARQSFKFQRADNQSDPAEVFILALLEGSLHADGGGRAEVLGVVELLDANGNLLQQVDRLVAVDSQDAGNQATQRNVLERFGLTALLVPGNVYQLRSEMRLTADPRSGGTASALFNDTFLVEVSGVPEPASAPLLTVLAAAMLRRRTTRPGRPRRDTQRV